RTRGSAQTICVLCKAASRWDTRAKVGPGVLRARGQTKRGRVEGDEHGAGASLMRAPIDSAAQSQRQFLLCVFLLWLAGNGLRITILAVPPVIPLIRTDLGMSETQVGI